MTLEELQEWLIELKNLRKQIDQTIEESVAEGSPRSFMETLYSERIRTLDSKMQEVTVEIELYYY